MQQPAADIGCLLPPTADTLAGKDGSTSPRLEAPEAAGAGTGPVPPRQMHYQASSVYSLHRDSEIGYPGRYLSPVANHAAAGRRSIAIEPSLGELVRVERSDTEAKTEYTRRDLLRSTKPRHIVVATTCLLYLLATALNLTIQFGSTSMAPMSSNIFLFQLDLSSVIPPTQDNTHLINSIARSIGLHDFYRVGLWSFCDGYFDTGVTSCTRPRIFFWFNPQQVFLNALLQRSRIDLPSAAVAMLRVLRVTSGVMFGTLFVGTLLDVLLLLGTPVVLLSRWWSLPVATVAALATLCSFIGASTATGVAVAIRVGLSFQSEVNIGNRVGVAAIVLAWVSAVLSLVALVLQSYMGYNGVASFRDIKTGRAPLLPEKTETTGESDASGPSRFAAWSVVVWTAVGSRWNRAWARSREHMDNAVQWFCVW